MMNFIKDSNCDQCNTVHDSFHITVTCAKYTSIRNKFAYLNNDPDLIAILFSENSEYYRVPERNRLTTLNMNNHETDVSIYKQSILATSTLSSENPDRYRYIIELLKEIDSQL